MFQDPGLSRSERRLRRGIAAAALLSCALLASAGPVSAAAARTLLELPCELRAGELVEIRWGPPAARVEETELVLSTDAGRHYSLHISPELDHRAGRFLWRVPNLPADRARLALRIGGPGCELVWAASSPFRITGDPRLPHARFAVCEGGAWDPLELTNPSRESAWDAPRARYETAVLHGSAETPPRSPACVPAGPNTGTGALQPQAVSRATDIAASGAPRFIPLRN